MSKRILIVTPRSPFEGKGADGEDRLFGIKWFIRQGYTVRVITKAVPSDEPFIRTAQEELGIDITTISYKFNTARTRLQKIARLIRRVIWPPYWDGAAFEYFDAEIQSAYRTAIAEFDPDIAYFDYSFLWPLYSIARRAHIPIVTRSSNMEPLSFLDENGRSFINYIRVLPKWWSEFLISKWSKVVFAITPREEGIYRRLGAHAVTLPLRALPEKATASIEPRQFVDLAEVHIGFTASTYTVAHNWEALQFLLHSVMPQLQEKNKRYILHFTGRKFPEGFLESLDSHLYIHEGFVSSMESFWTRMDIAVVPSLFGAGMQQKVFEPLMYGVPTITSARAIAGYPFTENEVVFAKTAEEYVAAIEMLATDIDTRRSHSERSRTLSQQIFSESALDQILLRNLPA